MFIVEFTGSEHDLKPCGKEIDEVMMIESSKILAKLSYKETAAYIRKYCGSLLK